MNFVNSANRIQHTIGQLLEAEDVVAAAHQYDQLDALVATLQTALAECRLLRASAHSQIAGRLRAMRHAIDTIDDPEVDELQLAALHISCAQHEIAPGVHAAAIEVASEDLVPDSQLYYVRSTGEYAVRILGCTIAGIVRPIATGGARGHAAAHDPARVWTAGNWLYTRDTRIAHMRHVGSRDTLRADIMAMPESEIATRRAQTAHDLLVMIAIHALR